MRARTSRMGRDLLRDVDETLRTTARIVLDAAVGPRVFDQYDSGSEFAYFCWYALFGSILDGIEE